MGDGVTSLRERRRVELRQELSDTATALFLERGFDAVTVAEIASACGVTEKTVFNHFRTKESLLVDRWPDIINAVVTRVSDTTQAPVAAVVQTLDVELDSLTENGTASAQRLAAVRKFGQMMASTPALQDSRRRSVEQLVVALRGALASRDWPTRAGIDHLITAVALSGLFEVFYDSLGRALQLSPDAATCRTSVRGDVRRAARLLRAGFDR